MAVNQLELDRHQELAEFLRSRRARLSPEQVGLSRGMRRRTPGLRREEVALLAGVSPEWYTWLEQGRDITVWSKRPTLGGIRSPVSGAISR